MNLKGHKAKLPAAHTRDVTAKTAMNIVDNPDSVNKMNLIASSDNNFVVLNNTEELISEEMHSVTPEIHNEKDLPSASSKEISPAKSAKDKKRNVLKEKTSGTEKTDNRKTEKLGLAGFILSFFGIIPLIGIPFAILAVTFGVTSLKRIKMNPEKYKGTAFATASLAIGCVMIVINIVILATSIKSASSTPAPKLNTSSTTCRY
jgi:hypothetical protein